MRKLFEKIVTLSLLLFFMGSFATLFLGANLRPGWYDASFGQGHPGFYSLEVLLYSGGLLLVILHYKKMLISLRAAWPFLLIGLMAILSTTWSVDPETTLRRSGILLGTTLFGIYLGGRYSVEEFQKVLLQALLVMAVASLVILIVEPSIVLDPSDPGAFRGLTVQKNIFGEYMGILLLLGLTYRFKIRKGLARTAVMLLAIGLLLWARSATSLLSTIATVLMLPVLFFLRYKKRQAITLTSISAGMLALFFVFSYKASNSVLDILGKNRTLTGRTVLWTLVWQAILRRPLLGYGFDAFWQRMKGSSLFIDSYVGFDVPNSHNGYLETLLRLGAIGMGLVAIAVFKTGYDAIAYVRLQRGATGFWPFAFLFYFLIHATAEASLVTRDGLPYLLFVVLSTSLSLRRSRKQAGRVVRLDRRPSLLPDTQVASL